MTEPSISWDQFSKAYLGCIAKLAEFTTELAVDAHEDLNLPYVNPFTSRSKRRSDEIKAGEQSLKHHDAFVLFVESVRKTQPFLRKATEKELEGIFARLTPAERRVYTEFSSTFKAEKKKVSDASSSKPAKPVKPAKSPVSDFIEDEDSDDVSLVSESDLDLGDEPERPPKEKKQKKKEAHVTSSSAGVKKFTWT